jgi:opacity protein-like surface antigen
MPFVRAGVGVSSDKLEFRSETGSTEAALSISKSSPEINGGLGVDFKANEQLSIGVEGLYHYGLTKFKLSDVTGDEADDFNWSHITYGARVMWHFTPAGK